MEKCNFGKHLPVGSMRLSSANWWSTLLTCATTSRHGQPRMPKNDDFDTLRTVGGRALNHKSYIQDRPKSELSTLRAPGTLFSPSQASRTVHAHQTTIKLNTTAPTNIGTVAVVTAAPPILHPSQLPHTPFQPSPADINIHSKPAPAIVLLVTYLGT